MEKASKSFLEAFLNYLQETPPSPIIMEGEDFKEAKFYEKLKKELVVVELTKEKPWEKKQRLFSWIEALCKKEGKTIARDVLETLYDACDKSLSFLYQETEKLLLYTGSEKTITRAHLQALCSLEGETNPWSLAEAIVWQDSKPLWQKGVQEAIDSSNFYAMLGQLRYHYQLGLQLQESFCQKFSVEETLKTFPQLQPKLVQKAYECLGKLPSNYFSKACILLTEYEILSKSTSRPLESLWINLLGRLQSFATHVK
ncbi:MAG: hypothetical protein FJZ63_06085 [Chlamydiae bacterium]|nr:hypothetical protein [Chlamydiota bacterium]